MNQPLPQSFRTEQAAQSSDARMLRTREALYAALLILLERKPFDQISIRDITAQATVGYATFFRHYATKEDLLNDLAANEISELLRLTLPVLYATNTSTSCLALCAYVDERRKLWTALLTGGAAGILREVFIQQAMRIPMEREQETWLPGDLEITYSVGATLEVLAWWLRKHDEVSVERVAEILDRLVIAPIVDKG